MRTVSLFSGIGGLDQGFIQAGFDVIWANDFDKYAVQTYRANYDTPILQGDINTVPFPLRRAALRRSADHSHKGIF